MRLIDADNLLYNIIGIKDGWLKPPKGVTTIEDLIRMEPTVQAELKENDRTSRPSTTELG